MVTLDQGGAGRPALSVRRATGRAARLAELSWVQHAVAAGTTVPAGAHENGLGDHGSWRIVPDAHPHVIHHRMRDGRSRTTVVGARSRWIDVDQSERAFTVGVRLRPGTLPLLLGVDAWALRDRSLSAADGLGAQGRTLTERLAEEASPEGVEGLLLELLRAHDGGDAVDWRVRGFLAFASARRRAHTGCTVRAAARALGVGERSLRDSCRSRLGLRPKEAHRILRLHAAIEAGLGGLADAAVAERTGYADQAHLIRESNALLGTTPEGFRARGRAVSSNTAPAPSG